MALVVVALAFASCGQEGNVIPSALTSGEPPSLTLPPSTASPAPSPSAGPTKTPTVSPTSTTASPAPTTTTPSGRSGIQGSVKAGPTCPVEQQNSPCPDRPVAGADVTATSSAGEEHSTTADDQGNFSLELPAGAYDVTASSEAVMGCDTQRVDVRAGYYTPVAITCDTGIR